MVGHGSLLIRSPRDQLLVPGHRAEGPISMGVCFQLRDCLVIPPDAPVPTNREIFQEAWCRVNENVRLKQLSRYTNNVVKFKGMFTLYVIIIWEDSNALQKSV